MADDDRLSQAFSLLELAARDGSHAACSSQQVLGSSSLPQETVLELHDTFGSFDRTGASRSRTAGNGTLDVALWEELASRGVSVGSVVQGLTGVMEKGGKLGIRAGDVYLGLLLAPGCPLYSLFSQLSFHALIRCIRNSCKPVAVPDQDGSGASERPGKGRGKGRRKRAAGKQKELNEDADLAEESFPCDGDAGVNHGSTPAATEAPSLQEILQLLASLQATLRILHLKEHQESLKTLLELLVELPHLVSEIQNEDEGAGDQRGPRARRGTCKSSSSPFSASRLSFNMMKMLLEPAHGEPMNTAVILLKLLAPSLLLARAGGSANQRAQIREQALHFVTKDIASLRNQSLRSAVVALPRYLAFKAPERTEARAQAVEAVMAVVKTLARQDQKKFGHFVAKLSRGKPRHRLFAVDLAVALLGGLPNPLGLDKDAEPADEECVLEEPDDPIDCFGQSQGDAANDGERADDGEADTMLEGNDGEVVGECGNEGTAPAGDKECTPPTSSSSVTSLWWGTACLEALLHRCSDKAPAIRARALTNLAQALELLSTDIRNRVVLQNLLGFGTMASAGGKEQEFSMHKSAILNAWQTPGHGSPTLAGQTPSPEPSALGPGASPLTPGAGHGDLGSLLKRRCLDEKVAVRKSTLFLMMKSASLLGRPPDETMLQAMGSACADSMVSIRKAALAALSEVMRKFPADTRVVTEWLQSALPLVMDNESSIQEECLSLFEEIALDRIASVAASRLPGCRSKSSGMTVVNEAHMKQDAEQELERLMPPGILILLRGMADGGTVASCVKRICICLGKKKRLRAGIALALQNMITASKALWCARSSSLQGWTAPTGAWLLLSEVSAFVPKAVGWEFLRSHWQLLEKQENVSFREYTPRPHEVDEAEIVQSAAWAADRVHLLQTISNVAVELPPDAAADLAAELLERLEAFDMHPTEVGAHVKALNTLCNRKAASAAEGDELVKVWVEELLEKASVILESYVSMCSKSGQPQSDDPFVTPKHSKSRRKGSVGTGRQKEKNSASTSKVLDPSGQIITAIFTVGALVLICPIARVGSLVALLQALIASTNSNSKGPRQEGGTWIHEDIARGVHAQSWVTLGKMCLANHELAKRSIPLFLQELEGTDSAAVRNNIMVAMTDFCIRYTSLVDGYIHKLTKSLRDPCELVRRQAFVLLARLLQRDYLKWRGTLFHRFLLALVDESQKICHMANFLFGSILKTKAPLLAYNSFVEAIFVLNDCHAHAGHSEMLQTSESERELFSLRGNVEAVAEKRMHIYACLLKQMAPEHILATSAKLCADILAAAADGLLDLNEPTAQCVLEDSLKILASKEMRIGGNRGPIAADNLDMEEEGGAAAFAAVKGRVVTQLAKRNLVQNAIPIFIELKRLLESKNSPLTGMLMECMRVMLKEYKNETEEILVADKQLQKEIMYDMQKHEAAKARAKVVAAATVVAPPDSGLRQREGSTSHQGEKSTSACNVAAGSGPAELPKKTPLTQKGKDRRKDKPLPGPSSKRKNLVSPADKAPPQSSRVKWLDQTPGFKGEVLHSARSSCTPGSFAATPRAYAHNNKKASNNSGNRAPVEVEETALLSLANGPPSREQNLASAVADVVAAATAAAVLHEVAMRSSTPLQSMSLPKLHATVPSTVKKASFESEDCNAGLVGLGEIEAKTNLESVRRRQSFSSIDDPCGPKGG